MSESHKKFKLWKSDTLNQRQKEEIEKVLQMERGRELLQWYQKRLAGGYFVDNHSMHYQDVNEVIKIMDNRMIPDQLPHHICPLMSTILLHRHVLIT
jgi:hypothetical protein